jgi:hypothetical protein
MLTPLGKKAKASMQRIYGKDKGTNLFYSTIQTRKKMGYVDGYQVGKPKRTPKKK